MRRGRRTDESKRRAHRKDDTTREDEREDSVASLTSRTMTRVLDLV